MYTHFTINGVLTTQYLSTGILPVRKDWALMLQRPEYKDVAALVVAKMDGKDTNAITWKMIKNSELLRNSKVLVDEFHL